MDFFDPHVRVDSLTDADLANLRYFDTTGCVLVSHAPRRFATANELTTYWSVLRSADYERARAADLDCKLALGVTDAALPQRSAPELWRALRALLDERVALLGELRLSEDTAAQWELIDRHARLHQRCALPLLLTPSPKLVSNFAYKATRRLRDAGVAPDAIVSSGFPTRVNRVALEEGGHVIIHVNGAPADVDSALDEALEHTRALPAASSRLMLSAGIRAGQHDLLGLARAANRLAERGVGEELICALVRDNARTLVRG